MYSKLKEHFGLAGLLVGVIALVAALAGGAIAASGGAGPSDQANWSISSTTRDANNAIVLPQITGGTAWNGVTTRSIALMRAGSCG